jgi:hypothetical protein
MSVVLARYLPQVQTQQYYQIYVNAGEGHDEST